MSETARLMRYDANKKSAAVAYVFWFFLGAFGAHRFYLGATGSGAALLIVTLASFLLMVLAVGFLTIWISAVWVFVDLVLIPGIARKHNNYLAVQLSAEPGD